MFSISELLHNSVYYSAVEHMYAVYVFVCVDVASAAYIETICASFKLTCHILLYSFPTLSVWVRELNFMLIFTICKSRRWSWYIHTIEFISIDIHLNRIFFWQLNFSDMGYLHHIPVDVPNRKSDIAFSMKFCKLFFCLHSFHRTIWYLRSNNAEMWLLCAFIVQYNKKPEN